MDKCTGRTSTMDCKYDISCFQKIAGVLTKDEIIDHKLVNIIDEQHKPKFETTTVDLTVGDGHYLFDGNNGNSKSSRKWKLLFIGNNLTMDKLNEKSSSEKYSPPEDDKAHRLVIPAYGSALVQLNEVIDTYSVAKDSQKELLIVGRFDLKLSRVHQGLISQQATQIEPCYCGKLFCFIHNLSNKAIELVWGEYIATIEFSYVSCFCNKEKKREIIKELMKKTSDKYSGKFCNGTGIDDIRYFYDENRLPDDCGLVGLQNKLSTELFSEDSINKLAGRVEKKVDKRATWIPLACAIISGLVLIITTIIGGDFKHEVDGIKEKVVLLQQEIEDLRTAYKDLIDTFDGYEK